MDQSFNLSSRQSTFRFDRNPMGASKICRWPDPRPLDEVSKFFRSALERQPRPARFEWHDCEHLPTDFENKVVPPLDLFSRGGERTAVLPNPIDVHAVQVTARGVCASRKCGVGFSAQLVIGLFSDELNDPGYGRPVSTGRRNSAAKARGQPPRAAFLPRAILASARV